MTTTTATLTAAWRAALATTAADPTPRNEAAEQRAWDALIDHVEVNGLNYTEADPR